MLFNMLNSDETWRPWSISTHKPQQNITLKVTGDEILDGGSSSSFGQYL